MVSLDGGPKTSGGDDLHSLMELLEGSEPTPAAELETAERREWVRGAVGELPDSLKSAVTLVYYQGLKYREAAEVLAIPVGTIKSRLHSALLKLNEAWHYTHTKGS